MDIYQKAKLAFVNLLYICSFHLFFHASTQLLYNALLSNSCGTLNNMCDCAGVQGILLGIASEQKHEKVQKHADNSPADQQKI